MQLPKQNTTPDKKNPFLKFWYYGIYALILFVILLFYFFSLFNTAREITWLEFENKILIKNAVEKIVVVNNEVAEIFIKQEFKDDTLFQDVLKPVFVSGINKGPHFKITIGSIDNFEKKLDEAQKKNSDHVNINVQYIKRRNSLFEILSWLIPITLLILFWRFYMNMIKGGGIGGGQSAFNFGKSTATLMEKENKSIVTFDDVAGLEEAKVEVKEIVDFLKDPKSFTRLGAKIPKGAIIVGPPGTGKTLLVKAVAGEAQVPFFSISGSEFVEMFVGVGASRVRDLFKKAKEKAPCIIFIDEIDAVGRSRGRNTIYSGANDERESTLNQLLTEMDGFSTNSGVIVLAATNRADMLDPALLRPGRFDRHIYLELPNLTERKEIFKIYLKPLVMDDTIDVESFASQTPGCSGADIANICNEAALIAARRKREKITKLDFMDAIDRISAGLEKKSKIISVEEKQIIAYHEAGHALVSWKLPHIDPLLKVSIVPRGKSLGAAWFLHQEHQLRNSQQLTEMLCAAFGGRAAEEIIFGDVTSGALDDLEKVTRQAYNMVAYYGFDKKIGNVSFYDSTGRNENAFQKPYSEETARLIDEEVRNMLANAYERTKNILIQNKSLLIELAGQLIQKEVLQKEDLEKILGKRDAVPTNIFNKGRIDGDTKQTIK